MTYKNMLTIRSDTFNSDSNTLSKVLESVKNIIDEQISEYNNIIIVEHNSTIDYPMVYNINFLGHKKINLGNHYNDWCRYIFQFAHEYCHIRTNFQQEVHKHQWIEEIFSHMASHYVLLKLAEIWKTKPLFEGWQSFANNLKIYSDDIIKNINNEKENINLMSVKDDLLKNNSFDYNQEQRIFFEVKCLEILLLFQNDNNYWKALEHWNTWNKDINDNQQEIFNKWKIIMPNNLEYVVEKIYCIINE